MQFTDIFYVTLLVVVTASLAQEYEENAELMKPKQHNLRKRETIVVYDNFPDPIYKGKPSVVYRRISHQRHNTKPKYGPPRTKYRSMKPPRRPLKKYKKPSPKYGPPTRKKRPNNPIYGPPKYGPKPVYGSLKKHHQLFSSAEPVGFGEPPNDFYQEYSNPKQSFAEPPTDFSSLPKPQYNSYQLQDFSPISHDMDQNFGLDTNRWNQLNNFNMDTNIDYSNKEQIFKAREPHFDPSPPDADINEYLEYQHRTLPTADEHTFYERRRQPYFIDDIISVKPKKIMNYKVEKDELVVGGKYAEPPARIVHKSYSDNNPYEEDDDSPEIPYIDPDVAVSATMSPYINYKNSNIAFSPQNLNDAFSIVDKK